MSRSYISIFSGIGGLEHPHHAPLLFCEQDEACQKVLKLTAPEVPIVSDVRSLKSPPSAEFVVGGWPCQDISSAGTLGGIRAERSGLFFEMLRIAKAAGAHTLIGENVPNLLTINHGLDFQLILDTLSEEGFSHIGWRVLNARQFGLPQQRRRLFIVASRYQQYAEAIHVRIPVFEKKKHSRGIFAFYWTGGKRSICWSEGYTPALKIGATDNNGRAPIAILIDNQIRKLTSQEFLRLQGFDELNKLHIDLSRSTILRMAGNAVPRPMGHFVVQAVSQAAATDGVRTAFGFTTEAGLIEEGLPWAISHADIPLAYNLADFLDKTSTEHLSSQAAAGLLVRSMRSGQPMPLELFDLLRELAARRTGALRPSRANSFEALNGMEEAVADYRASLTPISGYRSALEE